MAKQYIMNTDASVRKACLRMIRYLERTPGRKKNGVTADEIDAALQPSGGLETVIKILEDLKASGEIESAGLLHYRSVRKRP